MTRLSSGLLLCGFLVILMDFVRPFPHIVELDDAFERLSRLDPKRDPRCRQCSTRVECLSEPKEGCRWGVFEDRCGHINCLKGPKEHCDTNSALNRCNSELNCVCNICTGCTRDEKTKGYECYYEKCLEDLPFRTPKYK